ncbi:MAG: HTH domain-containing protein [candidate division Zixibacteria bacterium]|nr:HTH domain-containing protein [candidate division Zixibacteria bacterium]
MKKPERIATMIQFLASHPGLTLDELSRGLGISHRAALRRIQEVVDAGFPIIHDNGYLLQLPVSTEHAIPGNAMGTQLQGAIDQLVAHPAIRGDSSLVNSLKEIAKFAATRDKVQDSLLDRARQGSGVTPFDLAPPLGDAPTLKDE